MSITDFLNARIAEDKEQAEMCRKLGWFPGSKYEMHAVSHARVLAECAAKRAIVESMDILTNGGKTYQQRMNHSTAEDAAYVIASDILRTLAAVYADHPDYQDEWRVGA